MEKTKEKKKCKMCGKEIPDWCTYRTVYCPPPEGEVFSECRHKSNYLNMKRSREKRKHWRNKQYKKITHATEPFKLKEVQCLGVQHMDKKYTFMGSKWNRICPQCKSLTVSARYKPNKLHTKGITR